MFLTAPHASASDAAGNNAAAGGQEYEALEVEDQANTLASRDGGVTKLLEPVTATPPSLEARGFAWSPTSRAALSRVLVRCCTLLSGLDTLCCSLELTLLSVCLYLASCVLTHCFVTLR